MSKYFQKPTGKEKLTSKRWYDKWHAYLYGDSKAKEGVIYRKVFLDDFEKMKKKKTKNKLNSKTVDRTPINVSTMGDDDAPNTSPNEIHVGGNHLYYEEENTISYAEFMKKVDEVRHGRSRI